MIQPRPLTRLALPLGIASILAGAVLSVPALAHPDHGAPRSGDQAGTQAARDHQHGSQGH